MSRLRLTGAVPLRAFDSNGDPVSGATVAVYEAGTTDVVATYAEQTGSTIADLTTDAEGYFSDIYVEVSNVRVVVSDGGVELWNEDNVALSGQELTGTLKTTIDVTDYPSTQDHVITTGYSATGDGGDGLYKRAATEPSHDAKAQSPDGTWWELVPEGGVLRTAQVGNSLSAALSGWTSAWHTIDFGSNVITMTGGLSKTMSGSGVIRGRAGGGILASNAAGPSITRLLDITTSGHDLTLQGVSFDGNNEVPALYRVYNPSSDTGIVQILDCVHKNLKRRLSIDGQGVSDAVRVRGGYQRVLLEGCVFKDISREAGVGTFGSAGTTGIAVFWHDDNGTLRIPVEFQSKSNLFERITCEESGSSRVDCDAIKYFNDEDSQTLADTEFFLNTFSSTNDTFIDCIGRSIKVSSSQGLVDGATIMHGSLLPINGGFADIAMLGGGGRVTNCQFIYDDIGGLSPFTVDGAAGADSKAISFFSTPKSGRETGGISITDNIVRVNVPDATGSLEAFAECTRSAADDNFPLDIKLHGNKVINGKVDYMLLAPTADSSGGDEWVMVGAMGNYAHEIAKGLVGIASNDQDRIEISAINNTQRGSTSVALAYNSTSTVNSVTLASGLNNIGFTDDVKCISTVDGERSPSVPRFNSIFPRDTYNFSGGVHFWSERLADDVETAVREMGTSSTGVYIVSTDKDRNSRSVFLIDSSGVTIIGATPSEIAFGTGSNPDTDARLNIWHDGTNLGVKNRLGSTYVITLAMVG